MTNGRPREFDEREAIEAAMQLFWERGFEATSKRGLMEATGLASQSLYNTFGDKRQLFERAIRHYLETRGQVFLQKLQGDGSPIENLREVVALWAGGPDSRELEKGCLLCNTLAELGNGEDSEFVRFLRSQLTMAQQVFADTIDRAKAAGELPTDTDSMAVAAALVGISNGISLMRRVGAPKPMLDDAMRGALQLLAANQAKRPQQRCRSQNRRVERPAS